MKGPLHDVDFTKLQPIVDDWVRRYPHIAEISFLRSKKHPFYIDFVLCDPPRIAPKWKNPLTIKNGFFKHGPIFLQQDLLEKYFPRIEPPMVMTPHGILDDYKEQAKKKQGHIGQWIIDIRWETDSPRINNIIADSKKVLYSAPKIKNINDIIKKFTQEDYAHFKRLSYFTKAECLGLLLGYPEKSIESAFKKHRIVKEVLDEEAFLKWEKNLENTSDILDRAIKGGDLTPREDPYELEYLDAKDPTFPAKHFFEWMKQKTYPIPGELQFAEKEDGTLSWPEDEEKPKNMQPPTGKPANANTAKVVDYSQKTKNDTALLAKAWQKGGMTRREIAKKLYPKEFESSSRKINALMKRVSRLLEMCPSAIDLK